MKIHLVWLVLSAVMFGTSARASDLAATIETCDSCHGNDGVSEWSDMPTIAGIDAFVHSESLYIFRDKERPCATSKFRQGDTDRSPVSMCDIAADLSDETIEALAEHYAALPFVAAKQDFDPSLAAAGKLIHERDCERCHSEAGSNPDDEASILAGQWTGYMRNTFAQYASGEREQLDKMKEKMDALSEADVEALLHYYASRQ